MVQRFDRLIIVIRKEAASASEGQYRDFGARAAQSAAGKRPGLAVRIGSLECGCTSQCSLSEKSPARDHWIYYTAVKASGLGRR